MPLNHGSLRTCWCGQVAPYKTVISMTCFNVDFVYSMVVGCRMCSEL